MYKISLNYASKKIDIEQGARISILSDNSGIGKTYVAKVIGDVLKLGKFGKIRVKKDDTDIGLAVIDENTKYEDALDTIKNTDGLIIIDEADVVLHEYKKLVEVIKKSLDKAFLLIMRSPIGLMEVYIGQYLDFNTDKEGNIVIRPLEMWK